MREAIDAALKAAMKSKDRRRICTLRLINAAVKDRDIAARAGGKDRIADDDILQVLSKMIKQRDDSVRLYEEGGRCELAEQEREEIAIIREFLPRKLDDAEVRAVVSDLANEIEADGLRDMGRLMTTLRERYPGQIDMGKASGLVRQQLG